MQKIKLYSSVVCPFAQRTRIALLMKKIECETVEIDLTQDSKPEYLKLNPEGTVPTIVHNGRALYESSIVNEYLGEVFPTPALFPADPWQKAVSRILIDYCNRNFISPFYELLMNQDRNLDAELSEKILSHFKYLNERLMQWNPNGTFVWQDFGMADLTYAPFFKRFVLLRHYRGLDIPNNTTEFKRVRRWFDALISHPIVHKTSLSDAEYIKAYEPYSRGAA